MADVLGHADPALTLRVYAHAMRGEEEDLSFAEYGSRRLSASPTETVEDRELAKSSERLARREGFEPPTLHERTRARTRTRTAMGPPQAPAAEGLSSEAYPCAHAAGRSRAPNRGLVGSE